MQNLTPEGLRIVTDAAKRHGVSLDGALVLLDALARGNGRQAQFNHPDLGGMGQWSQGGMIMIGDMFNQGLKYRVDALCNELAGILRVQPFTDSKAESSQSQTQSSGGQFSLFVAGAGPASQWWPAELGSPASTGAQNDLRYACFPGSRQLAIQQGGQVRVYDTGEHRISGFSQQQGGDQSLTFTSQYGLVCVADLVLVVPEGDRPRNSVRFRAAAGASASIRDARGANGSARGGTACGGGHRQDDRAPRGTPPKEHSDRRGVRVQESGALKPPLSDRTPFIVIGLSRAIAERRRALFARFFRW
jgi:hypothetical protein